ncbi:hypothetical protein COBT_001925 [Conglomerata obtusa]
MSFAEFCCYSLFLIFLAAVSAYVVILAIIRKCNRNLHEYRKSIEIEKSVFTYKRSINQFYNIKNEPPHRLKNLHLLFRNINSIQKKDEVNSLQEEIDKCVAFRKKKIIRKFAYDYVYNLLIYFSEKYSCCIYVELICYQLAYNKFAGFEMISDWIELKAVFNVLVVNYESIANDIINVMTDNIADKTFVADTKQAAKNILDKSQKSNYKLQNTDSKNKEVLLEAVKNYEDSLIETITIFDSLENIEI